MRAAFHVSSAFNGGWPSPRAPPEPRAQVGLGTGISNVDQTFIDRRRSMAIWRIYEDWVKPEQFDVYEEKVKHLADRAASAKEKEVWDAYATAVGDAGKYYYAMQAPDFTKLAAQGSAGGMIMRVFGQKEGAKWLRELLLGSC